MFTTVHITLKMVAVGLVITAANTHAVEKKHGSTSQRKIVGVVRSADVPAEISTRIASHVKANVPLKVQVLADPISGSEIAAKTHVANARAAEKKSSTPLVVLAGKVAERPERIIISKKDNVALINVGGFQQYLKQPDKISDECCKRIDRATMKAVGTLFGLKSCQNPFCAMSDVEAKPHIPLQGRNYCPVCLPVFEEIVGAAPILNRKKAEPKPNKTSQ